ncbi:MAG: AAA family ATPase [Minicystis sp.]
MPTSADVPIIARDALLAVLRAPLPQSIVVDGHPVKVTGEPAMGEQRVVTCDWTTGSAGFRLLTRGDPAGLEVLSERGQQCAWSHFGKYLQSAVDAGKSEVVLLFYNVFYKRGDGDDGSGENRRNGERSRRVAAKSNLPGTPSVAIGRYQIDAAQWLDDGAAMLGRLLTLALIKAHFFDNGKGTFLKGAPLFSLAAQGTQGSVSSTPEGTTVSIRSNEKEERFTALHTLPGPAARCTETLREWLQRAQDEQPTEAALEAWAVDKYEISALRARFLIRHLRNMELFNLQEGVLTLTDAGLAFLESGDGLIVYAALKESYTGLEETLEFFAQHPRTRIANLLPHLNRVQGTRWETETQARVRADWLVGLGLLDLDGGRFQVSDGGRAVLQQRGLPSRPPPPDIQDGQQGSESSALRRSERARLDPTLVSVADLVLPEGLVERCCAALNAGKHILLIGPPGTAKSTLAERLADHAATTGICNDPLLATASADWTTYDTIGGWTQRATGGLSFREGVVTRALREQRWLVLDEVNRADIDKCFGELFTVLAGGTVTTAYSEVVDDEEVPIQNRARRADIHLRPLVSSPRHDERP